MDESQQTLRSFRKPRFSGNSYENRHPDLINEEGEYERGKKHMQKVHDPCSGINEYNLPRVTIKEEREYKSEENDINQTEICSDPCVGPSNGKASHFAKLEQTESLIMMSQRVKEEEIPVNIVEGLSEDKQPIVTIKKEREYKCEGNHIQQTEIYSDTYAGPSNDTQSFTKPKQEESLKMVPQQHVKEEEIPINISEGLNEYHLHIVTVKEESESEEEDIQQTEMYSDPSADGRTHGQYDSISNGMRIHGNISANKDNNTICGDNTTSCNSLKRHQRIQKGKTQHSCSECGKCFRKKSHFIIHERSHTGEKPFECPECGKCFSAKKHLVAHQKCHSNEKPFPCSECGKCFGSKANLNIHQRSHTGEKPYKCTECDKCFSAKGNLLTHQKSHKQEKPFACSECGKCFVYKSYLSNHQKIHSAERPFVCSACGKSFISNYYLVDHQKIHSEEKPFMCSDCGKCFISNFKLLRHQRSHTGEKPFPCSQCGKCFSGKSNLIVHQRVHTGEKPFVCSECGDCFTRKENLDKHQVIHTRKKSLECS